MKNFIILLSFFSILLSCSKNPNIDDGSNPPPSEELKLETKEIILESNDENDIFSLNFPTILSREGFRIGRRIYITKDRNLNLVRLNDLKTSIEALNSNFLVSRDTCSNDILSASKTFCIIDLIVSYDESIQSTYDILISGTDEATSPKLFLFFNIDSEYKSEKDNSSGSLRKSAEVLNYGIIFKDQVATKRVYFFNTNRLFPVSAPTVIGNLPTGFSLGRNTCSGFVFPGNNCFMDLDYTHQATNNDVQINETITLNASGLSSNTISVAGINKLNPDITNLTKIGLSNDPVKFPFRILENSTYTRRVYLLNNLLDQGLEIPADIIANAFAGSSVRIIRDSCTLSSNLKNESFCYLDLAFDAVSTEPIQETISIPELNLDIIVEAGDVSLLSSLRGNDFATSTQVNSFIPVIFNYEQIISSVDDDYSDVTYEIVESTLAGDYICDGNTCFYTANTIGNFYLILKGTKAADESEKTVRIDVEVFGSENTPVFETISPVIANVEQGGIVEFNLESATSNSDPIVYELLDFPSEGILDSCLDTLLTNGNTDLSCRYTADTDLFRLSFRYKAINTTNDKFTIKEVVINILDSDTVLDVYSGADASLALNDNGFVFGKGLNNSKMFGIVADYRDPSFVFDQFDGIKVPLPDKVDKLFVKRDSAIAKLANGEYYAWGSGLKSRLAIRRTQLTGLGYFIYTPEKITEFETKNLDFEEITISENSSCGLTTTGEVWCWGSNENGELGYDIQTPSYGEYRPFKISFGLNTSGQERLATKLAITSVNSSHFCAIVDNEAHCWGKNDNGQLGIGKTNTEIPTTFTPTKVALNEPIKEIAIGDRATCIINLSNELKCWGLNDFGQLGQENEISIGETVSEMTSINPVNLGSGKVAQKVYFGAGGKSVCALLNDATVKCWGKNDLGQLGNNSFATVGNLPNQMGDNLDVLKDNNGVPFLAAFLRESGTEDFCLRSNTDQKVFCWGNNSNKSISEVTPYLPAIPTEYVITPGDTAPFLANNSTTEFSFITKENTTRGLDDSGFTNFQDLYTADSEVLYFLKDEGVNPFTGVVYDKNDNTKIAGRLPLDCLNGVVAVDLRACIFTPEENFIGEFTIEYQACSSNLKCADDFITLNGRVVDPVKPYFEDNNVAVVYEIDPYLTTTFELSLPEDPNARRSGVISANDTVVQLPVNRYAIYDDQDKIAGIVSGCALDSNPKSFTRNNYTTYRRKDCTFYPKENFKGVAHLEYRAINEDGIISEVRRVEFRVKSNYSNVVAFSGSEYLHRGNRAYDIHGLRWYSSLWIANGGSDNSLAPSSSYDIYPTNWVTGLDTIDNFETQPRFITAEQTIPTDLIGFGDYTDESIGVSNICSINIRGEVVCWGNSPRYNATGVLYQNLENDSRNYTTTTARVTRYIKNDLEDKLTGAKSAEAGHAFSCAILGTNNEVKCWGKYAYGCNETIPRIAERAPFTCPVIKEDDTLLDNVKEIEVGNATACATTFNNELYCWGYKLDAQGNGTDSNRSLYSFGYLTNPADYRNKATLMTAIPGKTIENIYSNYGYFCTAHSDNTLACMGSQQSSYKVPFVDDNVRQFHDLKLIPEVNDIRPESLVSHGQYSMCYISTDNKLKCWGYAIDGLLKDKETELSSARAIVGIREMIMPSDISSVKKMIMHYSNMCMQSNDGRVKCWGYNNTAQTGNPDISITQTADEVDFIKKDINGEDLIVKDISLENNSNIYLLDELLDNDDWYQNELNVLAADPNSTNTINLFNGTGDSINDAYTIIKNPTLGELLPGENFGDLNYNYTSTVNGSTYFDKVSYIRNNERDKVYTFWFRIDTDLSNSTTPEDSIIFKDNKTIVVQEGTRTGYLYNSTFASVTGLSGGQYGFKILDLNGIGTQAPNLCYEDPKFTGTGYYYYCQYDINPGLAGQSFDLDIEISDGTNTKIETFTFYVEESTSTPVLTETNPQNFTITPYEELVFKPVTGIINQGSTAQNYQTLSGIVNDSGTLKMIDINGVQAGTVNNCRLAGGTLADCIFTPFVDYEGDIVIEYKLENSGILSSDSALINISVTKSNLTGIPFSIGQVNSTKTGDYQTDSYLFRLQGGSDTSVRYFEPYPVPFSGYYIPDNIEPIGGRNQLRVNKLLPKNITQSSLAYNGTIVCLLNNEGKVFCRGPQANQNFGGSGNINTHNSSTYFNEIRDFNKNLIEDAKQVVAGQEQSCAIRGLNNEVWCWGNTKNITNNNNFASSFPRSGCGSRHNITLPGRACPIVLPGEITLTNAKDLVKMSNSTCAIIEEASEDRIYCWGRRLDAEGPNGSGNIDNNLIENSLNYATALVNPRENIRYTELSEFNDLSYNAFCARSSTGELFCAGTQPYLSALDSGLNNLTKTVVDIENLDPNIAIHDIDEGNEISVKIGPVDIADIVNSVEIFEANDLINPVEIISQSRLTIDGDLFDTYRFKMSGSNYQINYNSTNTTLSKNYTLNEKFVAPNTLKDNGQNILCMATENDDFYCLGQISAAQNFLDNSVSPTNSFNIKYPQKIDFLSQENFKDLKKYYMDDRNFCYIDEIKDVRCFGSNYYGKAGQEQDFSTSSGSVLLYNDALPILQSINGNSAKANELLMLNEGMILISEGVYDINIDLRPIEQDYNQGEANNQPLISNVDTENFEYTILTKPTSQGTISGPLENLIFTPADNFSGTFVFEYRVFDKNRNTSIVQEVILKVSDTNLAPKGESLVYNLNNTKDFNVSLSKTDTDNSSNQLSCLIVTPPTDAESFSCNDGNGDGCYCTYVNSSANPVLTDSFTYQVNDGEKLSEIETITLKFQDSDIPIIEPVQDIFISANQRDLKVSLKKGKRIGYRDDSSPALYYKVTSNNIADNIFNTSSTFLKDELGNNIIDIQNCFLEDSIKNPTGNHTDTDCDLTLIDESFTGVIEVLYDAIDPSDQNAKISGTIRFNINSALSPLYGIGSVATGGFNYLGDFSDTSKFYKENGGAFGNDEVSYSSSRETKLIPVVNENKGFSEIGVAASMNGIFCFENLSDEGKINCLNNSSSTAGGLTRPSRSTNDNRFTNIIRYQDDTPLTNISKIAIGSGNSCAIKNDGTLACWGAYTTNGNVGPTHIDYSGCGFNGTLTTAGRVCNIVDDKNNLISNVIDVAPSKNAESGQRRTCLIKEESGEGKVYCWGHDILENSKLFSSTPKLMIEFADKDARKLNLTNGGLCVSFSDNTIRCMGNNYYNKFSNPSYVSNGEETILSEMAFLDENNNSIAVQAETLEMESNKSCILGVDKKLYCIGYSSYGEFKQFSEPQDPLVSATSGDDVNLTSWKKIYDTDLVQFKSNQYGLCVQEEANNKVKCWGYDIYGQFGNDKYIDVYGNPTLEYFNNRSYVAQAEADYIQTVNGTDAVVDDFYLTLQNTYVKLPLNANYIVPYSDVETTVLEVNENDDLALDFSKAGNNFYKLLYKPSTSYLDEDNSTGTFDNYVIRWDNINNPVETFLSYLVHDTINETFIVRRYIFKINPENDAPIYQNKTVYFESGVSRNITHNAIDPDNTTTFTYELVDDVSVGTLSCSGNSCSYEPPVTSTELNTFYTVRVIDEEGLEGESLGRVDIVIKPIVNPFFLDSTASKSIDIEKGVEVFYFINDLAEDPNDVNLTYNVENETVKSFFDPTLGQTIAAVYDSSDLNKVVGYLDECFLDVVNGSNSNRICKLTITDENFEGSIVIQYSATNGAASSAIYNYNINIVSSPVEERTLKHVGYDTSLAGIFRTSSNENIVDVLHYFERPEDSEFRIYRPQKYSFVEDLKLQGNSMCFLERLSPIDPAKIACADISGSNRIFGFIFQSTPSTNVYDSNNMKARFSFMLDENANEIEENILSYDIGNSQFCYVSEDTTIKCRGNTSNSSLSTSSITTSGCGFRGTTLENGKLCQIVDQDEQILTNIRTVKLGNGLGCAINNNDELYCWGYDVDVEGDDTQIGYPFQFWDNNGQQNNNAELVDGIGLSSIREVDVWNFSVCAIKSDNTTLTCFGNYSSGVLGLVGAPVSRPDRYYYVPRDFTITENDNPVNLRDNTLNMDYGKVCVIGENNKLYCWGSGYGATPQEITLPSISGSWQEIKMNTSSNCIRDDQNHLYCWGSNTYGQFGVSNATTNISSDNAIQLQNSNNEAIEVKSFGFDQNGALFFTE